MGEFQCGSRDGKRSKPWTVPIDVPSPVAWGGTSWPTRGRPWRVGTALSANSLFLLLPIADARALSAMSESPDMRATPVVATPRTQRGVAAGRGPAARRQEEVSARARVHHSSDSASDSELASPAARGLLGAREKERGAGTAACAGARPTTCRPLARLVCTSIQSSSCSPRPALPSPPSYPLPRLSYFLLPSPHPSSSPASTSHILYSYSPS